MALLELRWVGDDTHTTQQRDDTPGDLQRSLPTDSVEIFAKVKAKEIECFPLSH